MQNNKQVKATSASSAKTSPRSNSPSHASKTLLDVDAVSVDLGHQVVLDTLSFCIHSGEFIGLIGPNGAGKTTLLRTLLGLQQPSDGSITRHTNVPIGYVPQRSVMHNSPVALSVLEVVQLGSHGNKARAMEALKAVDMADASHKRFTELSGGQQQRVFIAKILASNPEMLILDEPTTGIDERSQAEFYNILRTLQQKGITILMVSHDVDTVLSLVTRVICLNRSIVYDGPAEHFETDKYMPTLYKDQHRILHHHHEGDHHA